MQSPLKDTATTMTAEITATQTRTKIEVPLCRQNIYVHESPLPRPTMYLPEKTNNPQHHIQSPELGRSPGVASL